MKQPQLAESDWTLGLGETAHLLHQLHQPSPLQVVPKSDDGYRPWHGGDFRRVTTSPPQTGIQSHSYSWLDRWCSLRLIWSGAVTRYWFVQTISKATVIKQIELFEFLLMPVSLRNTAQSC